MECQQTKVAEMETTKPAADGELFQEICIDDDMDSDSGDEHSKQSIAVPEHSMETIPEHFINFEKYIQQNCANTLHLLNRSEFDGIKKPIILGFNHFRHKFSQLKHYLDLMHQVALIYGERIEFIVTDLMDIDILHPHTNPLSFFSNLVRPENESVIIFAIDTRKRIYRDLLAKQTYENLKEICEKLLSGVLYRTQSIIQRQDTLLKMCVHQNYEKIVNQSDKDTLLIVNMGDYNKEDTNEPNYEHIANELKNTNFQIVYMNSEDNYIPYELNIGYYPTLTYIPHNDKENFLSFEGNRNTNELLVFLQKNLGPQGAEYRESELSKIRFKPFCLNSDLTYENFADYLNAQYPSSFKVFQPHLLGKTYTGKLILVMNLRSKGLNYYLKYLQTYHQLADRSPLYTMEYFIADFQDISSILPNWYIKILSKKIDEFDPFMLAIDCFKRKYRVRENLNSPACLYYYCFDLLRYLHYRTESKKHIRYVPNISTCVADNLLEYIRKSKYMIFLAVYNSSDRNSAGLLKELYNISAALSKRHIKLAKIDSKHNYIPLQYSHSKYPVFFFIPCFDRDERIMRYEKANVSQEELMEFIELQLRLLHEFNELKVSRHSNESIKENK